ncbi:hypothetical protein ACSV5M_00230 [Cellvibrio sp. ARAG 10.3]|uniref:hypothetical protein n=1 Tax=Cellvibrio sp. ARAG 10.3 TaxID=3451358 RepID=UPI003F4857B1
MVSPSLLALEDELDSAELDEVSITDDEDDDGASEEDIDELTADELERLLDLGESSSSEEPPQAASIRLVPSTMPRDRERVCVVNAPRSVVGILLTSFVIVIVVVLGIHVVAAIRSHLKNHLAA